MHKHHYVLKIYFSLDINLLFGFNTYYTPRNIKFNTMSVHLSTCLVRATARSKIFQGRYSTVQGGNRRWFNLYI